MSLQMKPSGPFVFIKPAVFATLTALMLSGCMQTSTPVQVEEPKVVLPVQPEISQDSVNYAARNDGKFTVPAIPADKIPPTYRRQTVAYETAEAPGTIIIDPNNKLLYYVLGDGQAVRYGISVGAEGFQWSGTAVVSNKRTWPRWTPPAEMIARKPSLEKWRDGQPGGPTNPLGSRAIYLTTNGVDYGYRIHGTPEWRSIGRNASSGCFRMINQDVMDLYERVTGGEKVVVLTSSGEYPTKLNIPSQPKPKKPAEPVVTPEAAATTATPSATDVTAAPSVPAAEPNIVTSVPLIPAIEAPAVTPVTPVDTGMPGSATNSFSVSPSNGFSVQQNTAAPAAPALVIPEIPAPSAPSQNPPLILLPIEPLPN